MTEPTDRQPWTAPQMDAVTEASTRPDDTTARIRNGGQVQDGSVG